MGLNRTSGISRAVSTWKLSEDGDLGSAVVQDSDFGMRQALAGESPAGVLSFSGVADDWIDVLEDGCVCAVLHDLAPAEIVAPGEGLGFTGNGYAPALSRGLPVVATARRAASELDGAPLILVKLERVPGAGSFFADPGGQSQALIFCTSAVEPGATFTVDGFVYTEIDVPVADGDFFRGANATESAINIAAAVNADTRQSPGEDFSAIAEGDAGSVFLYWGAGSAGNVPLSTDSAGNLTISTDSVFGRDADGRLMISMTLVVTAHLDQVDSFPVFVPFVPKEWHVEIHDLAGEIPAYALNATVETSPDRIVFEVTQPPQKNIGDTINLLIIGDNI